MKILVVSESFIIRDSLNHLLNETLNTNDIITSSNANHLSNEDLLEVDFSFIDVNKNNINIVKRLSKIRRKFKSSKIMILDSQKDIELFIKSVGYGIDGYILNIDDKHYQDMTKNNTCDIHTFGKNKEADLIIFSMGSLYTSVLPNIICKEVEDVLNETKAPIMYTCNIVTQPGETDNFTVGDHVKLLNRYLDKKKVDVVIANNAKIEEEIAKRYESQEQKDPVLIDYEELEKIGVELIEDNLLTIDDNTLKHDSLKLSSLIFSYLMRK